MSHEFELTYVAKGAPIEGLFVELKQAGLIGSEIRSDVRVEIFLVSLVDYKEKVVCNDKSKVKYIRKERITNDSCVHYEQSSTKKFEKRVVGGLSTNCIYVKKRIKGTLTFQDYKYKVILSTIIPVHNMNELQFDLQYSYVEFEGDSSTAMENVEQHFNLFKILSNCNYEPIGRYHFRHKREISYGSSVACARITFNLLNLSRKYKLSSMLDALNGLAMISKSVKKEKNSNVSYYSLDYSQQYLLFAHQRDLGELTFKIFAPEDNLIFLMFHAIKHLGYVNLAREIYSVNLQHFYDIAQIISIENINWDLFVSYAVEYDYICPTVALFLRMFVDIFPDMIPSYVVENIYAHTETLKFHWKQVYNEVIKSPPSNLIIGDYQAIPFLHEHRIEMQSRAINPDYIWIWWARFYLKLRLKRRK
jgi:hypothetical protein